MQQSNGTYADINGLQMYYEIHGEGQPLILIHGGLSGIQSSFAKVLPEFAKHYKVIAVELQGHAHTADIDRPFSCAAFADDVIKLMGKLGLDKVDILGYSLGAGVALEMVIKHPEKIGKIVLASGSYTDEAIYQSIKDMSSQVSPEMMEGSPYQIEYANVAPKPENWAALVKKMGEFEKVPLRWDEEDVKAITAPVFLVIGDSDIIMPEPTITFFRLLKGGVPGDLGVMPKSRLAILPATTHTGLMDREEIVPMINDFLNAPSEE